MVSISIFLPARNYTDILFKNLNTLSRYTGKNMNIQILISDDSDDPNSSKKIKKFLKTVQNAQYLLGPQRGAVANWNSLFEKSDSDYYWFIHHDELISENILLGLEGLLKKSDKPDLIFLLYKLSKSSKVYYHSFKSIISPILKNPKYIFLLNPFGSPSSCIFHKTLAFRYDEKLKYLVDVDLYYRQLLQSKNVYIAETEDLSVTSNLDFENNDTRRLNLSALLHKELHYLDLKYKQGFTKKEKMAIFILKIYHRILKKISRGIFKE